MYDSVLLFFLAVPALGWAEDPIEVMSPEGTLAVTLELSEGVPSWSLVFGSETRIEKSRLGVQVEAVPLGALETVAVEKKLHREEVETTWGKFALYDDHFHGLRWTLRETAGERRTLRIAVRVYDDGMAFRYEFPEDGGWGEGIELTDGATEFRFAGDYTGWGYHGERDPLGPQPLSEFASAKGASLPLTIRCAPDAYLAVLEAAIFDQAPFRLAPAGTSLRESFAPSTLAPGGTTSWRVVLAGEKPGELLTTPLLHCLNPPCAIADTDWIEPGLAFWDWRAWGARTEDGFTYQLDMASWRRFIDFASANHIRYLVLDANWYGPEFEASSDPRTSRDHLVIQPDMSRPHIVRRPAPEDWAEPVDVPALIRYGNERNVGLLLYFNDVARTNYPFEETLALYQEWGAAGIKYGFMKAKGQQKVLDTREIVRLCAKHELLCNFHDGPIPPSGDERTYPNYVTREFCHSQSDAMRVFSPTGFCEQVFVNMLAGPLDMCNGLFALENPAEDRPRIFTNVEATVVAETARVMITYSGFAILPDCPEAYAAKADLFDFLRRLPMTWDETRILHGSIGEYITTARRSGDEWFIASATNEEARTLPISFEFLERDRTYTATLYEDTPESHFQTNREAYRVRKLQVTRETTIAAELAPGGGGCIFLQPEGSELVGWWPLDSFGTDTTEDVVRKTQDSVEGGFRVLEGVKGKALRLDGFKTFIRREAEEVPVLSGSFTVEGWVALGAYPWSWGPVVDHRSPEVAGFTFGIDMRGHFGVVISGAGEWQTCTSIQQLPLTQWIHVAVVHDPEVGLVLYRDGQQDSRHDLAGPFRSAENQPLFIGRNYTQEPWEDYQFTAEGHYSFLDGALDELKIYDRALTPGEIDQACQRDQPSGTPDLPVRVFPPVHRASGTFGAYYTKLDYYPEWDALWRVSDVADVLVRFEQMSGKLVFWRGTSFVPCWVTENGIWFTNEWLETWGGDVRSCAEPLMDRECRFSHVRIIESSEARTIVHWRYALVDAYYTFAAVGDDGRGEWCDEFYITYPDGTGVRKMVLHYTEPMRNHDWAEQIVVLGPGTTPRDVVASPEVILVNMQGEEHGYTWDDDLPVVLEEPKGANIEVVNLKAKYRPFLILPPDPFRTKEMDRESPFFRTYSAEQGKGWRPDPVPSVYGWWDHWPIAQVPGDGRWVLDPDRASHFNLTAYLQWEDHELTERTKTRIMLQGLTDKEPRDLVPLARSWIHAPELSLVSGGYRSRGYDPAQRAYVLSGETPGRPTPLEFELAASAESPLVNLAVVIEGWGKADPAVKVNGKDISSPEACRFGHASTLEGTNLIVWLELESTVPVQISLE